PAALFEDSLLPQALAVKRLGEVHPLPFGLGGVQALRLDLKLMLHALAVGMIETHGVTSSTGWGWVQGSGRGSRSPAGPGMRGLRVAYSSLLASERAPPEAQRRSATVCVAVHRSAGTGRSQPAPGRAPPKPSSGSRRRSASRRRLTSCGKVPSR